MDESPHRGQRNFSTSVALGKRPLAQVVILENFHLATMETQAILLEVISPYKTVVDEGYERATIDN